MVGKYKDIHIFCEMKVNIKNVHWFSHSKNMASFEVFCWNISSRINLLFVKSDIALYIRIPKFWLFLFIIWKYFFSYLKYNSLTLKRLYFRKKHNAKFIFFLLKKEIENAVISNGKNLSKYDMAKKKHNKLDCLSTIVLYYNLLFLFFNVYFVQFLGRKQCWPHSNCWRYVLWFSFTAFWNYLAKLHFSYR